MKGWYVPSPALWARSSATSPAFLPLIFCFVQIWKFGLSSLSDLRGSMTSFVTRQLLLEIFPQDLPRLLFLT